MLKKDWITLEGVIEPEIGRTYGILVSEDDFSSTGQMKYKPPCVTGNETDFKEIAQALELGQKLITQVAGERDRAKRAKIAHKKH